MKQSVIALVMALCASFTSVAQTTFYVVPKGTEGNTPTAPYDTWETAANEPADAVDQATTPGDVVLVRAGTYMLTRKLAFQANDVTIKSHDGSAKGKVCPEATVFDLSTLQDDAMAGNGKSCPIVEGLTFKNQHDSYICIRFEGGQGNFQVRNCRFVDCSGTGEGKSVNSYVNTGVITGCRFENCTGNGQVYSLQNAISTEYITVDRCVFVNVASPANGGAINAPRCIHVQDSVFENCSAGDNQGWQGSGGAISAGIGTTVVGCTFTGNMTGFYGSIINIAPWDEDLTAVAVVSNCSFTGLSSSCIYGAVHFSASHAAIITGCAVTNNVTMNGRGLVFNESKELVIRNSLLSDSGCDRAESPVWNHESQNVSVENCTFDCRGAVERDNVSKGHVSWKNCIFVGDAPVTSGDNIHEITTCLSGMDPEFVSAAKGDYRLRSTSPAIDRATQLDWMIGATDLRGRDRIVGSAPDIGCYERQPDDLDFAEVVRVVACESEKKGEWASAYTSVQAAVDAASDGALVLVKAGVYDLTAAIVVSNRTLTIWSCNPETGATDREGTVFDGGSSVRAFVLHPGPILTDGSELPQADHPVELKGFTFRNCVTAEGDGQFEAGNGGAIWMFGRATSAGKTPSIINDCAFENCAAVNGGGVWSRGGTMMGCCFVKCTASATSDADSTSGGGVCANSGSTGHNRQDIRFVGKVPHYYDTCVFDCVFESCAAPNGAFGGLASGGGQNIVVWGCDFRRCSAQQTGGCGAGYYSPFRDCSFLCCTGHSWCAALKFSDTQFVSNCTFAANVGGMGCLVGGEGEASTAVPPINEIVDCVITNNETRGIFGRFRLRNSLVAGNLYAGINLYYPGANRIENSTIAGNQGVGFSSIHETLQQTLTLVNTIVYGNANGDWSFADNVTVSADSSLFADAHAEGEKFASTGCHFGRRPGFKNTAAGDYSLRDGAFARDKGKILDWMTTGSTDLNGNPRLVNAQGEAFVADALPDIGCFEAQGGIPGMLMLLR